MRWTAALLLQPVTFVLAVVAAVLTGNRTGSVWLALLAFLVALGAGRALRSLVRGRTRRALERLVWPAAATGYAFLFGWLGVPAWANLLASVVAAALTRGALFPARLSVASPMLRGRRAARFEL